MRSKLSRRDFLKVVKRIGLTTLASFIGTYYTMEFEPSWLDVTQVELKLEGLPKAFDGFRIAQISDVHIGGWMNRERFTHVVERVLEQEPDLVVMTGDYVIGHTWDLGIEYAAQDFIDVISPLTKAYEVVGVLGNHDHWTDPVRVRAMLAQAGVLELKNDVHRLSRGGQDLYLAGLDDISEGEQRLEEVTVKLPAGARTILLAHEPDYATTTSATGRFMLQLSGHSHGGQVVIPFVGPPILPRWARRYPAGLYQLGKMYLYTCRGVGMTSPFVRFNCRPEISVFTLKGAG
ncbi:metallophosphoesterase [Chloroflexota bacterium]